MVIRCALSVPEESIKFFTQQISGFPPLPEYISRKGPYFNKKERAAGQIIVVYEFDKSKLSEVWSSITNQLNSFHGVSGFAVSAYISESGESVKSAELTQ